MLKKFVAIVFAGFMAVSLVGCAPADTAATDDGAAATSTDEGADTSDEEGEGEGEG